MPATVDTSRHFIPEPLTPLFHTPGYARLTQDQRRRYNQLHATYVNEQILFFEQALAENILGALLRQSLPSGLRTALGRFRDDEAVHSRMFRELNQRCAPDMYAYADFYFVRVPASAWRLLSLVSRRPTYFPLFIWLMLMLEERALHYGSEILRQRATLEPHFVATHHRHLRDEARHVRWDQDILDWLWPQTSPALRKVNAMLFRWMIGEFLNVPKRAAFRVVQELVTQCPDLAPRLADMSQELGALGRQEAYHLSLYSRHIVPQTFCRFDQWPEFAAVSRVLLGYRPLDGSAR